MARSRDTLQKKSPIRKAVKKGSNPKQNITIPMVLNCNGKASDLLPWFIKVVEMLSKECTQKMAAKTRAKGSGKTQLLPLSEPLLPAIPIEGIHMDTADYMQVSSDDSVLSEFPLSNTSDKSTRTKSRKQVNVVRCRKNWTMKHRTCTLAPKRKYTKRKRPESDSVQILSDVSQVHLTSSTSSPCTSWDGPKLVVSSSTDSGKSIPDSSDVSMPAAPIEARALVLNEAVAKFDARMMMFLTAQRAALDAFNAAGDGLTSACRSSSNQTVYRFPDAWNEVVRSQDAEIQQAAQCEFDSSMEHLYLSPSTDQEGSSPRFAAHIERSKAANVPDATIFNHIRNSLHDICHNFSAQPNRSTSPAQTGPNCDDAETSQEN
ncbi:hypothetical protein AWZ03_006815 [Drosophila navojoa]|uniref:Uncharacterized protein n=1 Tax=Drosophila navojoa TaxID=7232 RepID=A0A484BDG4_DRONA|nr:hypothetical protein AWZ03_006815 [Drosophila navojoa]